MFTRTLLSIAAVSGLFLSQTAFAQQQPQITPFSKNPFTDVAKTHPNYEAIEYLRQNNVLKGYIDGSFKPDARINRAEFVKLIANPFLLSTERLDQCIIQNVKDADIVFFNDVKKDAWFAPEVCLAWTKKLIRGYPDSTFRPGNYINFVEAAKILAGVFSFSVVQEPGEHWYRPYVQELAGNHAIPYSITGFSQMLTRGDMAEMLYRLKTHTETLPSRAYGDLTQ